MKFLKVAFLFAIIAMIFAPATARPDFWKDLGKGLERAGQNVRDAIINAGPAVDTIARAQQIAQGGAKD